MNTTPKAVLLSCITTAGRVLHASNADADTVLHLARELADAVHDAPDVPENTEDRGIVALNAKIMLYCQSGNKVKAIKHHRAVTGASLKDAKDYVESLMQRAGL